MCPHADDLRSMQTASATLQAKAFWNWKRHIVPDPSCACGMYAGINMEQLIEINCLRRGIHNEVSLWRRLYRHTFGWRAQYAYRKLFLVPANMVPFRFDEAQERLKSLVEFNVDIYLQPERAARVVQERIPPWIRDYGDSQQGISFLIEKRQKGWFGERAQHMLDMGGSRVPKESGGRLCKRGRADV
jgi:hypothetical protein